ncbi:hypothetical protein G9A89_012366 [Geosiphon pyriformis]|nr:hypothetical protein G9A89_012366 [Geosiphon pyriformis]
MNSCMVTECAQIFTLGLKAELSISGSRISVAKRSESYHYLGIFLSTESLSKLSLAKAHADVRFFSNVVLRKAITEKQFLYLVSAVLQPIVCYRLQFSFASKSVCEKWDKLLRRSLKLKANLPKDFPSMALHHPKLYGLKPFEQVLTENLMANLVNFNNTSETLSRFLDHRVMDLQAASWMSWHPLCFPIMLPINLLNCFLAGATHALTLCNTSLCGILLNIFKTGSGVPILDVLGVSSYLGVRKFLRKYGLIFANQLLDHCSKCFTWNTFHKWKRLDSKDPISIWFVFISDFIKCGSLNNDMVVASRLASGNVVCNTGFVSKQLLAFEHRFIDVYMNGSVKSLGFINACGGAAAYFSKADVNIGMRVLGLLFFMLMELQAIALALECVFDSSMVILFMNSQTLLNICKFEVGGFGSDFQSKCWIEKECICQVISDKNLSVMWRKVKEHSGIIENEHANFFVNAATLSKFVLSLSMLCCFLSVENRSVSENVHHFIRNLFNVVNFIGWESKFGTNIVGANFAGNIDSSKSFSVWHPDISASLPASRCEEKICKMAGVSAVDGNVMQFLCETGSSDDFYMLLAKGFVLKSWVSDAALCLGLASGSSLIVKLVHNLAESYRSDIWMPAAKLKAFYKKHNFLPHDRLAVLSIVGLPELLGIHMCFSLCLCLTRLDFSFLNSISLIVPACV